MIADPDREYRPTYEDRAIINVMLDRHDDGTVTRRKMTIESIAFALDDASWRETPSKFRERDEPVTQSLPNVDLNAVLKWLWTTERVDGVVTSDGGKYQYTGPIPDTAEEMIDGDYDEDYVEDYIAAYQDN